MRRFELLNLSGFIAGLFLYSWGKWWLGFPPTPASELFDAVFWVSAGWLMRSMWVRSELEAR